MPITDTIHQPVLNVPASDWTPAVEPDGDIRDDAWAAELADDCLNGRPKGIRLTVRREHTRPGAQLRFTDTDTDRTRLTCFATNTVNAPIAALELPHRQRDRDQRVFPLRVGVW